jgi:hypothetical protein
MEDEKFLDTATTPHFFSSALGCTWMAPLLQPSPMHAPLLQLSPSSAPPSSPFSGELVPFFFVPYYLYFFALSIHVRIGLTE